MRMVQSLKAIIFIVLLGGPLGSVCGLVAQEERIFTAADMEFFENQVRPLLVENCLECHGDQTEKIRGGLRLTSRAEAIKGGDSGPAIVPGKPDESLLIEAIHYESFEMPPTGKLSDDQIGVLTKWIELGAPDPRANSGPTNSGPVDIEEGRKFWAFQALQKVSPPDTQNADWPRSTIDRFILARLAKNKLEPAADTNRETLLRRVYFALIGLPPSEKTVEDFVASSNSLEQDLEDLVDELLASSHFGERWGRHWLDVARFAESSGGGRSLMFPEAWRYRDYVIDSFNKDKRFDQFTKEQIAGDLLPYESQDQRSEFIVATGFLALGPTNYEQQDKELLRMEVIDEQVDTIGRSFMALTLGCARCHDHKFDPIPTQDYYALAGIFQSTKSLVDGNVSSYVQRSLATDAETAAEQKYKQQVAKLTKELSVATKRMNAIGGAVVTNGRTRRLAVKGLPGIVLDDSQAELTGQWKKSTYVPSYVGENYIHDDGQTKGKNQAVFSPSLVTGGQYEVRMSYSPGGNRASNVPVTINHQDGRAERVVNQSQDPPIDGIFISLGTYRFEANNLASVTISTDDTDGVVIVDAVQFILQDDENNTEAKTDPQPVAQNQPDAMPAIESFESDELRAAKQKVNELNLQLKLLKQDAPRPIAKAMSVDEEANPRDGHIHIRGSVRNLGDVVPRGFVSVICNEADNVEIPTDASGRLELARWIANSEHPLTARVYVNRVWRHLFGKGLVATTDNFGKMGQRPSHPELLDYLASKFIEDGWSTKKLIREIILSRVFRMSTTAEATSAAVDPENRLLWRANRRRVDAEVLRDSMLAISGQLDLTTGGLTIRKIEQYDLGYKFDSVRRSVYVPAFRNTMLDLFEVFDIANPNLVVGNRNTSTLPMVLRRSDCLVKQDRASPRND